MKTDETTSFLDPSSNVRPACMTRTCWQNYHLAGVLFFFLFVVIQTVSLFTSWQQYRFTFTSGRVNVFEFSFYVQGVSIYRYDGIARYLYCEYSDDNTNVADSILYNSLSNICPPTNSLKYLFSIIFGLSIMVILVGSIMIIWLSMRAIDVTCILFKRNTSYIFPVVHCICIIIFSLSCTTYLTTQNLQQSLILYFVTDFFNYLGCKTSQYGMDCTGSSLVASTGNGYVLSFVNTAVIIMVVLYIWIWMFPKCCSSTNNAQNTNTEPNNTERGKSTIQPLYEL